MAVESILFTLNDGTKMPALGIGCWMGSEGNHESTEEMVKAALQAGYRSIDTASGYGNEERVGRAVKAFECPRSEVYITTKLRNRDHHRVKEAFEKSIANLDTPYIDQYLMHWPQADIEDENGTRTTRPGESPTFIETWRQMEDILISEKPENGGKGRLKSIGVSNFSQAKLEQLFASGIRVVPVTNQIELHPCLPRTELIEYCKSKNIVPTAYTPLGGRRHTPFHTDPFFKGLAEKHNLTTGQVVLSWTVQRGTSTFPMSSNPERINQNIQLIKLPDEDMKAIDEFHKLPGHHRTLAFGGLPGFFGWTWEDLEFPLDETGYVKGSLKA